jgi:hypothetical protein
VDGCQCGYTTNVEKKKPWYRPGFFSFWGVKSRQNEGYKIKERIFCHNILILEEILSNLEI